MEGSPLVIGQLLLHQEQVGLQLVPLLQDLLQLFHGEAALSRAPALILARRLLRRQRCRSFLGMGSVRAQRSPQSRAPAATSPAGAGQCGASGAALLLLLISLWVCSTAASRSDFFSRALLSCACTTATLCRSSSFMDMKRCSCSCSWKGDDNRQ